MRIPLVEFREERDTPNRPLLAAEKQELIEHPQPLSVVHEVLIGHIQKLFPIVGRIVWTAMNCSVWDSSSSASAVRLIRPGETDAVTQAFSASPKAVITSRIPTITAYLAPLNKHDYEWVYLNLGERALTYSCKSNSPGDDEAEGKAPTDGIAQGSDV
ncbi:hypothetical protein EKO27_g736 [Xylaria grammica]|uniref:Uncharacterized protein n=1 Tax=Xylaria grammica TaxID=363999 RepID=A0A439DIX4_9PEZI|nr:hypothetical protein EKO27_g736 [Xylaria grammica]